MNVYWDCYVSSSGGNLTRLHRKCSWQGNGSNVSIGLNIWSLQFIIHVYELSFTFGRTSDYYSLLFILGSHFIGYTFHLFIFLNLKIWLFFYITVDISCTNEDWFACVLQGKLIEFAWSMLEYQLVWISGFRITIYF